MSDRFAQHRRFRKRHADGVFLRAACCIRPAYPHWLCSVSTSGLATTLNQTAGLLAVPPAATTAQSALLQASVSARHNCQAMMTVERHRPCAHRTGSFFGAARSRLSQHCDLHYRKKQSAHVAQADLARLPDLPDLITFFNSLALAINATNGVRLASSIQ